MKVVVKFSTEELIKDFDNKDLAKLIHKCVAINVGKYVKNDQLISVKVLPYVLRDLRLNGIDPGVISFPQSWTVTQLYNKLT